MRTDRRATMGSPERSEHSSSVSVPGPGSVSVTVSGSVSGSDSDSVSGSVSGGAIRKREQRLGGDVLAST